MMVPLTALRAVALDVDGVLTDGTLYYGARGEIMKAFSARDGMGISLARLGGLQPVIITGRTSTMVAKRAADLKIKYVFQGKENKWQTVRDVCRTLQIDIQELAYMGDDWNDLQVLRNCGFSGAPADACQEVRQAVQWVSSYKGGQGAVREWIEYILRAQGKWQDVVSAYDTSVSEICQ